jgi:diguanylate cyclase (GGDEF)-like protein
MPQASRLWYNQEVYKSNIVDRPWGVALNTVESRNILILSENAENIRQWAEALQHVADCIWADSAAMLDIRQPDVIVTDTADVFEADSGVIRVGNCAAADVNLPADASARELQLACRLLADLVHLRRREQMAAQQQRRLYAEAFCDPLTGLPNRRAWDETLPKRLSAIPSSLCLCLAIYDLDLFKKINDTFGHSAGDEVLRAAGRAICESLRQGDFVARIGGDEFGLLIWAPDAKIAAAVVERVRMALPVRLVESGIQAVTASAGLAVAGNIELTTNPAAFFARADEALRRAKQSGRDRTLM